MEVLSSGNSTWSCELLSFWVAVFVAVRRADLGAAVIWSIVGSVSEEVGLLSAKVAKFVDLSERVGFPTIPCY